MAFEDELPEYLNFNRTMIDYFEDLELDDTDFIKDVIIVYISRLYNVCLGLVRDRITTFDEMVKIANEMDVLPKIELTVINDMIKDKHMYMKHIPKYSKVIEEIYNININNFKQICDSS